MNKSKIFWVLNVLGWLIFHAVTLIVYYKTESGIEEYWLYLTYTVSGFMTTLVLRLFYRRILFRNESKSIVRLLVIIFSVSILTMPLYKGLEFVTSLIFIPYDKLMNHLFLQHTVVSFLRSNILGFNILIIWSILYYMINLWFDIKVNQERMIKAELYAKNTHLKMLRYQLNPHFLFNSLNSIQALMYKDVEKADLMLTELSEFLRYTLKFNNDIYITLKDEIEIIRKYLFVEKIRFDKRLDYNIQLPDSICNEKILCFITQPFIENAIKHGMKGDPYQKLKIRIEALKENDWLVIRIYNTGRWGKNDAEFGLGIKNVNDRLNNAYGNRHNLSILQIGDEIMVELKIQSNE